MHISSHLTSHDHRVMLATKVNYCIPEGVFTSPLWDKRSEMEITMENENKQQINEQKCPAAVAAKLVRKAPDIRHADR